MTSWVWELEAYDRNTEYLEEASTFEIPAALVSRVKQLAGIAKSDRNPAVRPLSNEQAAAIAELIGKPIDPVRYEYFLAPFQRGGCSIHAPPARAS